MTMKQYDIIWRLSFNSNYQFKENTFGFGSRQNWFMPTLVLRVGWRFEVSQNNFPFSVHNTRRVVFALILERYTKNQTYKQTKMWEFAVLDLLKQHVIQGSLLLRTFSIQFTTLNHADKNCQSLHTRKTDTFPEKQATTNRQFECWCFFFVFF